MTPKLTEVTLPFPFQPNRWYHVAITHSTGSALSSSVIRMFVDGSLEASSRFKYAKVWTQQSANASSVTAWPQIAGLQPHRSSCNYCWQNSHALVADHRQACVLYVMSL